MKRNNPKRKKGSRGPRSEEQIQQPVQTAQSADAGRTTHATRDESDPIGTSEPHSGETKLHRIWEWLKKQNSNWYLVVFTALLVISTTYFNYRQTNLYELTTHIENRAYINVPEPELDTSRIFPGKPLFSTFQFENLGHTPAYNVQDTVVMVITDTGVVLRDPIYLSVRKQSFTIGGSTKIPVRVQTTTPYSPTFDLRKNRIYIFGKIEYKDVFGEPHLTTFFFEYMGTHHEFTANQDYTHQE